MSAVDSIFVQNGVAHEIWRGIAKDNLPPMHPAILAQVVEAARDVVQYGYLYSDGQFSAPAPSPPSPIGYADFRAKLTDAEKQALHTAMSSSWQIDDFVGLARAQNSINITSDVGLAAKAALVSADVLTQDRADLLFNPATWQ